MKYKYILLWFGIQFSLIAYSLLLIPHFAGYIFLALAIIFILIYDKWEWEE